MWSRKELKERAITAFKANYWSCVIVALIFSILIGGSVSLAGGVGRKRSTVLQQTSEQTTEAGSGTLSINGEEIKLDDIDGDEISKALDTISEGLEEGKLNINGEDIDLTDEKEISKVQDVIKSLRKLDLSRYSHEDIVNGASGILAIIGGIILILAAIGSLIKIFLLNPLLVGCHGFFMVNSREKANLGEIKRGFSPSWIHNVGAMLLKDVFLFLWSLIFIVPGIIKSYSYSMVPYILADDPNLGAREAITLSRKMMDGNKWRAFVLDLSFIGWLILSVLTLGLLGIFYVYPYVYSTHAELYKTLREQTDAR